MASTSTSDRGDQTAVQSARWSRIRQSAAARAVLGILFVLVPSITALVVLEQVYLTFFGPDSSYLRLGNIVAPLILAVLVFGSYVVYARFVDGAWPSDLQRGQAGRELLVGTLFGSGLFTVALAVVWVAGSYSVVSVNPVTIVLPAVTGVMFFASIEEVINRGIILPEIESRFGGWIALLASSLLFAGYHTLLTTNPTGVAVANIFVAGLLMGGAYLYTRQLWLPIAIHAGWNFTQGAIFGVRVSGNDVDSVAFLVGETNGPAWLTGGAYGLEASLVSLVVLSLGTGIVLWYVWQRGDVRSRP